MQVSGTGAAPGPARLFLTATVLDGAGAGSPVTLSLVPPALVVLALVALALALATLAWRRGGGYRPPLVFFAAVLLAVAAAYARAALAPPGPATPGPAAMTLETTAALAAVAAAVWLWLLVPRILRRPSTSQLHLVNRVLEQEVEGLRAERGDQRSRAEALEGRVHALEAELAALRDELGRAQSERSTAEAEQQRLAGSAERARQDAARAEEALSDLRTALSRHLRSPLQNVLGWSRLLQRGARPPEEQHALATLERSARALARLLDELVDSVTADDGTGGPSFPDAGEPWRPRLRGVAVLVVDDEQDCRDLVQYALEQAGATVTTVASSADALDALADAPFDALVCDLDLPDEDGTALLRRLRRRAAELGGAVPAVALTAWARQEDRQRAAEAGFESYLAKPVTPETLVATVAAVAHAAEPLREED